MKKLTWFVPAMFLVMSACGGTSVSDESPAPVPEGQFIESYAAAICDNIGPCCEDTGDTYAPDECRTLLEEELRDLLPLSENDAVSFDATRAGGCIAAVAKAAKSCGGEDNLDAACERVYAGKLAEGETCQSSWECATPAGGEAYCDMVDEGGAMKCVVTPRGASGDACGMTCTEHGSSTECSGSSMMVGNATCYTNDGLYCADNGACAQLKTVGEACTYDGCVHGAYCDETGVCAPFGAVGESCAGWGECVDGAVCMDDGVCGTPKPVGAACTSSSECEDECEAGVCVADAFVGPAICSGTLDEQ
jgi:hypothetical protein